MHLSTSRCAGKFDSDPHFHSTGKSSLTFAYYLQHRPGCFLRVGNGESCPMLHSAKYDFDDANLTVGAAYWTRLVERFLGREAG